MIWTLTGETDTETTKIRGVGRYIAAGLPPPRPKHKMKAAIP